MSSPDSQQRRAEIIHAVWAVIARGGVGAVTFRTVAAESGASVGRIQHHFGTRDGLLLASLRAMVDAAADANPEALEAPALDRLRALLLHSIPADEASRIGASVWFGFVAAGVAEPALGAEVVAARRGVEAAVAACLEGLLPDGADAGAAARELVLLADGATGAALVGAISPEAGRAAVVGAAARLGLEL